MPEQLDEALQGVQAAAHAFIDEVVRPLEVNLGEHGAVPAEVQEKVREASKKAGFFYKTQPAEFGGQPASTLELTVLRECWAAANSPTAYIFGPGPGVLHQAEGELKTAYLDPMIRGEKRGAFGFTEPDTATRPSWARLSGGQLTINGQKSYVTGGATADFVAALVNVEHEDGNKAGTAMVVIDRDLPGVVIDREFASMEGGGHVSMRFENMVVPESRIIGKLGEGMPRALGNIGNVRLMVSAQAVGMCLFALVLERRTAECWEEI